MKWIYCAALAAISLVAFVVYAADKGRAKRNVWRIPEKVLLGLSFFGAPWEGMPLCSFADIKRKNGISMPSISWGSAGRPRSQSFCF